MKKTTVVLFVMAMMVAIIAWALSDYAKADTAFICAVTKGEWVWIRSTPDADGEKIGTLRYGVEGPSVVDDHDRMLTDKQFNSGQYWEFKWGYGIDGCFIDGYDVIKAPYSIGTSYGCRRLISAPSPDPQAQAC